MRFLILTQYYAPEIGAPQVRLSSVAREIKALGHEVEVVTALPNHPTGRIFPEYRGKFFVREAIDGITIHRVWVYASLGSGLLRILNYASFMLTSIIGLVRSKRPDYVFIESPPLFLAVPGQIAARLWRAKTIFNVADLWPDSIVELGLMREGRIVRYLRKLEIWSYRIADKICVATEGIYSTLTQIKGIPASKIAMLPNGIDAELFKPQAPDVCLARDLAIENKNIVLYAGTHGYAHGIDVALHAAALLKDREDIAFLLIGDGSEKRRLTKLASELRLSNVHFLDPVTPETVARLYSFAKAGLSTLRNSPLFEGTRPAKIFAAMASGVPVLYSGDGEGARLVRKAQAGIITPPEDAQALANAVISLIDNLELAQSLGQNGRNFIEHNMCWPQIIKSWVDQLIQKEDIYAA